MKYLETYFKTAMTIFGIVMFGFLGILIANNVMGVPANIIFDFSLLCGFVCGFVPTIGKALRTA